MKNPIGNVGLFATPENMAALENWLGKHTGPEAAHVWTGAMMAWNLAGKYVDKAIAKDLAAKKALEANTPAAYRAYMNGGEA